MSQPGPPRGVTRHRGQTGQSLIEVIIAILLMGSIFGVVAGGLLTVIRTGTANENLQTIDAALVSYGEILQSQVDYISCDAPVSLINEAYFFAADNPAVTTGSNSPTATQWRRPQNVLVQVLSVRSFNPITETWANGCLTPDGGSQLIRYRVTVCRNDVRTIEAQGLLDPFLACESAVARTAEVIKRKSGPS